MCSSMWNSVRSKGESEKLCSEVVLLKPVFGIIRPLNTSLSRTYICFLLTSNMSTTILSSGDEAHVSQACETYDLKPTQFHALHSRCAAAKATAYCPYSQFRVGASILTEDNQYIDGANVENASYPVGTCAERVAFGKAVTEGHKKFKAVAVATDISPPASPCGMCRQL